MEVELNIIHAIELRFVGIEELDDDLNLVKFCFHEHPVKSAIITYTNCIF